MMKQVTVVVEKGIELINKKVWKEPVAYFPLI
jgi:hypothetical protein